MEDRMKVYCTVQEKESILLKAEVCGLSLSQFIRVTMFEEAPKQILPNGYLIMQRALRAALNNLTQIAVVSNTLKLPLADRAHSVAEDVRGRIFKLQVEVEG